jgi:DNA-binding NtrC family response regulator
MARFLVVDNETNAVSALRELLEVDGHEVAAFTSAREAMAAAERSVFEAALLDLEMSETRGDRIVRLTRELHPTACIFATHDRAPRGPAEACHTFAKPLDYQTVVRTVAACRTPDGTWRHGGCLRRKS